MRQSMTAAEWRQFREDFDLAMREGRDPGAYAPSLAKAKKAYGDLNPVGAGVRKQLGKAGDRLEERAGDAAADVARRAAPVVGTAAAKYGPTVARFAARAGLALAAGYAAYWITSQIMRMRNATVNDLRYELANQYRAARNEAAAKAGRPLTSQELQELSKWFKAKDEYLKSLGPGDRKIPFTVRLDD